MPPITDKTGIVSTAFIVHRLRHPIVVSAGNKLTHAVHMVTTWTYRKKSDYPTGYFQNKSNAQRVADLLTRALPPEERAGKKAP